MSDQQSPAAMHAAILERTSLMSQILARFTEAQMKAFIEFQKTAGETKDTSIFKADKEAVRAFQNFNNAALGGTAAALMTRFLKMKLEEVPEPLREHVGAVRAFLQDKKRGRLRIADMDKADPRQVAQILQHFNEDGLCGPCTRATAQIVAALPVLTDEKTNPLLKDKPMLDLWAVYAGHHAKVNPDKLVQDGVLTPEAHAAAQKHLENAPPPARAAPAQSPVRRGPRH